jgi:ankyrin repeat protein
MSKELFGAIEANDVDKLKELLESGEVDVNRRNRNNTPLFVSGRLNHTETMRILAEHGTDVNLYDTPLSVASRTGNVEMIKLLIENGANTRSYDQQHLSPLSAASWDGHMETMKLLIEHGADVNHCVTAFLSPLSIASSTGNVKTMKLLIEHGADVFTEAPLSVAIMTGQIEAMKLLIEHGVNRFGNPLSVASEAGNVEAMKLLMNHGAPIDGSAFPLHAPILKAVQMRHEQAIKLLLASGAEVPTEGLVFDRLAAGEQNILIECKALKDTINESVNKTIGHAPQKEAIKAIATSIVFSSDTPLPAPSQFETLANEAVERATAQYTKLVAQIQNYSKPTQNLILDNIRMVDDSLKTVNIKNWDVETLGPRRTLVNLAALHGDKIQGISSLLEKGTDTKTVKAFLDAIPVNNEGLPKSYSVGEFTLSKSRISVDPMQALDKVIGGRGAAKHIASFLGPEDIKQLAKHVAPKGRGAAAADDRIPSAPRIVKPGTTQKPSEPIR